MSLTAPQIRARAPGHRYTAYHAPRYARLLGMASAVCGGVPGADRLTLDIGRSLLTELLHEELGGRVDTLGFGPDEETPTGRHWWYDLNRAQREQTWRRGLPAYRLIVMGEVIEHLHTAPQLVLRFVASLLHPEGRLILQTPNAVSWNKRLMMLAGRHPYDPISLNPRTPAHFREYTRREIEAHAAAAGLVVLERRLESYFDYRFRGAPGQAESEPGPLGAAANVIGAVCPPGLRRGMTFVMARRDGG